MKKILATLLIFSLACPSWAARKWMENYDGNGKSLTNATLTNCTMAGSASQALTAIKTVDGAGSGLDADLLDGTSLAGFATASHTHATRTRFPTLEAELTHESIIHGMTSAAVSSGTSGISTSLTTASHPGVIYMTDSTTANGGYFVGTRACILLGGSEEFEIIFMAGGHRATEAFRMGWLDSTAIQTASTDGAWVDVAGNGTVPVLSGKTASNTSTSTTATSYALTEDTWYRCTGEVNATATDITFSLYNMSGDLLWSDSISSNLPTGAGREFRFGVVAGETTTDAASDICYIDYLRMDISRDLAR